MSHCVVHLTLTYEWQVAKREKVLASPNPGLTDLTMPRELVTVKGQLQTALSEIYTVKSNHAQLLRWTLDMGATVRTLLK